MLEHLAAALARIFRTPCRIRPETFDISFALDAHAAAVLFDRHSAAAGARVRPGCARARRHGVRSLRSGLTFVFGEAQLDGNCAVVSTARLEEEFYGLPSREELFRERLVKEAVHELGHTFGLRHCADWRCVMTSSHAVERLDVKGAEFCSACRKPVAQNGYW